jgi:tetratricopeptide (TPR) repeat protein
MAESGEPESVSEADQNFDSAALGIALDRARSRRGKPTGDDAADHFLAAQEALIADQRHHLREQFRHLRLKHFSERLKVALQLLTIAVGVALVATLGWMAFEASRADGVVIKPFTVAPDLARRGVTGEVVASQLLDKLTDITDRSQSSAAAGKFGAGFGQNISLQIPETGVSLGEVDRWLREKLGHEHTLTGEVIENPDGTLTIGARLDTHALPPQTGAAPDLPKLVVDTAEALYRREQPMTYVQYLGRVPGRNMEAKAVDQEMSESHDPVTRAFGLGGLGIDAIVRGDVATAMRSFQAADAANVGLSWPSQDWGFIEGDLGHQEMSLRLLRRALALTPRDPAYTPQAAREAAENETLAIAKIVHDHAANLALSIAQSRGDALGFSISREALMLGVAEARAAAHDGLRAEADAAAFTPQIPADEVAKAGALDSIAYARHDWANFLQRNAAWVKLQPTQKEPIAITADRAWAMSQLGRIPEALALIGTTPLDCQPCVVVRGGIANTASRYAESDHWFAEASRMAPSVPNGPLHWGENLLVRGDPAKAAVQFREALRRGPRAEDAMEGLGEALTLQGDAAGAVKQFAAANALTPKWGRLHLKWGEALAKLGKRDEAKAQFAMAAGLDLTAAERAELAGAFHG